MLTPTYETLHITSEVSVVIVSLALMLFSGFAMTRVTKRLRLPNVTAYIVAGILMGPYCMNLIPGRVVTGMSFVADIALAFIAFSTGEFFKFSTLKKSGAKVMVITVMEACLASVLAAHNKIQGVVVQDGTVTLSQSYGRKNNACLLRYALNSSETPDTTVTVNGREVKAYLLDSARQTDAVTVMPMTEALADAPEGGIYVLFESGATHYANGTYRTDHVWKVRF